MVSQTHERLFPSFNQHFLILPAVCNLGDNIIKTIKVCHNIPYWNWYHCTKYKILYLNFCYIILFQCLWIYLSFNHILPCFLAVNLSVYAFFVRKNINCPISYITLSHICLFCRNTFFIIDTSILLFNETVNVLNRNIIYN